MASQTATRSTQTRKSRQTITVAVIEDNRLVREGITALLEQVPDVRVVSASDQSYRDLEQAAPQVVLLDLGPRDGNSLSYAKDIRNSFPGAKMVIMDVYSSRKDVLELVNAGVSGFILKDATVDDLARTIHAVVDGLNVLPPEMTGNLFSQIARVAAQPHDQDAFDSVRMTPRERQVIDLIAEGLSNKEIASRLNIATHTVKSHVRNVMEKLMLHTRLQIAAFAHKESRQ